MKVSFYLDRNKGEPQSRFIQMYCREHDYSLILNTKEKIEPMLWNKAEQRGSTRKAKNEIAKGRVKSVNRLLSAYEEKVLEITRQVRIENPAAGFFEVAEKIRKTFHHSSDNLFTILEEFIQAKRGTVGKESIQKYKRLLTLLKEYDRNLTFGKLKPAFYDNFYSFLINEKNMLNNTAYKTISFLKTFIIWAIKNDYTDNSSYKSFRSKSEENEVIYLTEKELMHLYSFKFDNDRLSRARDLFVFQCFVGTRYSDVQNITRDDLFGATWRLRTQKTRQPLVIPLSKYAMSIIERHSDHPTVLPRLSNQKMNQYLKELCEIAGIDDKVKVVKYRGTERLETTFKKYEVIGSHTARRTFISLSLMKGMEPAVIMSITGHSDYKMMKKYLKIADGHKREQVYKVWGSPLKVVQ